MSEMKQISVPFELKKEPDDDGYFSGYASVFGIVDQGMDVVEYGAFTKTLGTRKVKMLWQHNVAQPIGVWPTIREDEKGLFVEGRVLKDVQQGREAMALMRAGAIDSMSIGYRTVVSEAEGGGAVRKLLEVDLFEISLVTFPMLPDAVITDIKSIKTVRDFEKSLRDAGYSKKEAKAIAANGFHGLAAHRDDVVDSDEIEGMEAFKSQLAQLQEKLDARTRHERSNKIL